MDNQVGIAILFVMGIALFLVGLAIRSTDERRQETIEICTTSYSSLEENLKNPIFIRACGHLSIMDFASKE